MSQIKCTVEQTGSPKRLKYYQSDWPCVMQCIYSNALKVALLYNENKTEVVSLIYPCCNHHVIKMVKVKSGPILHFITNRSGCVVVVYCVCFGWALTSRCFPTTSFLSFMLFIVCLVYLFICRIYCFCVRPTYGDEDCKPICPLLEQIKV